MPPQISDEERSDASSEPEIDIPVREEKPLEDEKKSKSKAKAVVPEEETLMVESDNDDEDDEEEIAEGEYVVEKITNHLVDEETGELKFEVKWEGYSKKSDRTWEPEENLLETASKILNEYLASVGGKDAILQAYEERKSGSSKKGKKRGRSSTGAENGTNGSSKRGRKASGHPASASPTASSVKAEFKPPTGSWEEAVIAIDACEGNEGTVVVYLTWQGGHKTQHPLAQVYKRCPQKMLAFYESHLVFKKNDDP